MKFTATLLFFASLVRAAPDGWTLTRDEHFEIYSDSGSAATQATIHWLEQVRGLLALHAGDAFEARGAVRVVSFRSVEEYAPYRLRTGADAYYIGTESHDYIVAPLNLAGPAALRGITHEYAHVLTHSGGLHWPSWFNEGFSEFISTAQIGDGKVTLGGDSRQHSQLMAREPLIPLGELLKLQPGSMAMQDERRRGLFYAESWALVEMLALSPKYAKRLPMALSRLSDEQESAMALAAVFGGTLDDIEQDLLSFIAGPKPVISLPEPEAARVSIQESDSSAGVARGVIAEALLAAGQVDRAGVIYEAIAKEAPGSPGIAAGLGMVALRKGDVALATRLWNSGVARVGDAGICYRFAVMGQDAGVAKRDIRIALERAVALKSDYDDARFFLATTDGALGDYESAVEQLQRMTTVTPARAYSYWAALSSALNELGRWEEAVAAAKKARQVAGTLAEQARAAQLEYTAQTDFTVQLEVSGDGQPHMVGTRKPRSASDWNPFVEAGDEIKRVEGKLADVSCEGGKLRMMVDWGGGRLDLSIPDPARVRMKNAPAEFICGSQNGAPVVVEYVEAGRNARVIRSMEFR